MVPSKLTVIAKAAAVVLGAALLLAIVIAAVMWDAANSREERDRERQVIAEVNRVCGSAPVSIERHGTGWSNGPFWEVECQDGTMRVVSER